MAKGLQGYRATWLHDYMATGLQDYRQGGKLQARRLHVHSTQAGGCATAAEAIGRSTGYYWQRRMLLAQRTGRGHATCAHATIGRRACYRQESKLHARML